MNVKPRTDRAAAATPSLTEHHEHWRFFADHPLPWELSDTSAGFAVEDAKHEVLWRFDHYNRADVERFVASLNDVVSVEEGPYIRGFNRGWDEREAAAATPSLDTRLTTAIWDAARTAGVDMDYKQADRIVASALARLDEGSATPDQGKGEPR